MTWTAFRTRGEILRDVSATADTRADGTLPWDVEGVERVFADELDLLGALQLRWHTRLAGRIERELSSQPLDLETAVVVLEQQGELLVVLLVQFGGLGHRSGSWVVGTAGRRGGARGGPGSIGGSGSEGRPPPAATDAPSSRPIAT